MLFLNSSRCRFSSMSSFRSVIAFHSASKSVTHFELIFSEGYRICVWTHCFTRCSPIVLAPFIGTTMLKKMLCQKAAYCIYVGMFLGLLFCSIVLFVCSFTSSTLSCNFIGNVDNQVASVFDFVLLLQY